LCKPIELGRAFALSKLAIDCFMDAEVTYADLAKRLKKHGFKDETEASVTNKLKRGTFPATWFLACLAALELDGVALEEI
jgi:Domain of unknown function (DUF6471)